MAELFCGKTIGVGRGDFVTLIRLGITVLTVSACHERDPFVNPVEVPKIFSGLFAIA